jgi:hypothetical protein
MYQHGLKLVQIVEEEYWKLKNLLNGQPQINPTFFLPLMTPLTYLNKVL